MQWIYILLCEGNVLYVGETKNLYARMLQHWKGGCVNTRIYKPIRLMALYKVTQNYNFLKYVREIYEDDVNKEDKMDKLREYLFNMDNYSLNKDQSLYVENYITEKVMDESSYKERRYITYGGKYTINERKRLPRLFQGEIYERPMCFCGLPCEVRKVVTGKKVKINYTCCVKNVWDSMRREFKVFKLADSCIYYKEYLDDIELRVLL